MVLRRRDVLPFCLGFGAALLLTSLRLANTHLNGASSASDDWGANWQPDHAFAQAAIDGHAGKPPRKKVLAVIGVQVRPPGSAVPSGGCHSHYHSVLRRRHDLSSGWPFLLSHLTLPDPATPLPRRRGSPPAGLIQSMTTACDERPYAPLGFLPPKPPWTSSRRPQASCCAS